MLSARSLKKVAANICSNLSLIFDAEAVVLKHIPGTGKLCRKDGALLVENRDGVRFKLGSGFNDDLRRAPPAMGSWISYRYRDLTGGSLPRFATYLRSYRAD